MELEKLGKLIQSKNVEDLRIAAEFLRNLKAKDLFKIGFKENGKKSDEDHQCTYFFEFTQKIEHNYGDIYVAKGKYYVEIGSGYIFIDHPKRAMARIRGGDTQLLKEEE